MSSAMNFRMCLRELCFLLWIFNILDVNHLVSFLIFFHNGHLLKKAARFCFCYKSYFFRLKITGVRSEITFEDR